MLAGANRDSWQLEITDIGLIISKLKNYLYTFSFIFLTRGE